MTDPFSLLICLCCLVLPYASATVWISHTLYAYLDRPLVVVNSTPLELMLRPNQYGKRCRAHCRLSRVSKRWTAGCATRAPGHACSATGMLGRPDWTGLD